MNVGTASKRERIKYESECITINYRMTGGVVDRLDGTQGGNTKNNY